MGYEWLCSELKKCSLYASVTCLTIYKSIASVSLYCHVSKWTNLNIEELVIKFLIKQGKTPKIIREEILRIFANGQNCLSMVENSLDDDLRPGRPVDTITLDVIEKTKYLVLEDLRLKERQLAPLLGVSETTVFRILHEYLGMKKASARWVPRMLSQFQMRVRMEMCEHFLTLCGDEPDLIINRFVTGDEIWAHLFDPKSKQELMQWHIKGSSPPKKFKVTPPAEKIMATVFCNCQGILMIDSLNKGSTVTGE
jgi:hypothetical protein